ncbi:hypothetical protein AGMMS49928_14030 [Spirochaetia bacterium]|nr:hypothetical protein AGMMS49928_14030 [Spirochaetia bacterium]
MMKNRNRIAVILFCLALTSLSAQEALKSVEEEYYDFLSLQGLAERSYLNYRTLSDSVWAIEEGASHPWQNHNLGTKRQLFGDVFMRIYGPELFTSYNTAAPYGQNDGALWQGRGFNSSLTGGVRFEGYGVELTFKPQLAFSQNAAFEILTPGKSGPDYAGKGDTYGYFWGGVDAPQRFGDEPFFTYDWGDTEIRYTWKTLTIGFGTQAIWLGPAYLNPMLHSNNAASYPKFDIGIRKQPVTIPGLGWYVGDVELRLWVGYLTESDYFDNEPENDSTMFHGLSFAYAPSFLPGFTLFLNRVCLVDWSWENLKYIVPNSDNTIEDQKLSFGISWIFPQVGFEMYGELGIDDYISVDGPQIQGYLRYPLHTLIYTVGLKKTLKLSKEADIYGEIIFEWNNFEMDQSFQFQWPYSFYFHHNIIHGYTNRGQLVGSGNGVNGNSQYLEFKLYYPSGNSSIIIQRSNPDNNYVYSKAIEDVADGGKLSVKYYRTFKASFVAGGSSSFFITDNFSVTGKVLYNLILNPLYKNTPDRLDIFLHNGVFQVLLKYSL